MRISPPRSRSRRAAVAGIGLAALIAPATVVVGSSPAEALLTGTTVSVSNQAQASSITVKKTTKAYSTVETMTAKVVNKVPQLTFSQDRTTLRTGAKTTRTYSFTFLREFTYVSPAEERGAWYPGITIKPGTTIEYSAIRWTPKCAKFKADAYSDSSIECQLLDPRLQPAAEEGAPPLPMHRLGFEVFGTDETGYSTTMNTIVQLYKGYFGGLHLDTIYKHTWTHRDCLLCRTDSNERPLPEETGEFGYRSFYSFETDYTMPGISPARPVIERFGHVFEQDDYDRGGNDIMGVNFTGFGDRLIGDLLWN